MQNSSVFRVFVNKVDVGALPEQDYRDIIAEVTREVKGDRRLFLAQAFNLASCFWRITMSIMRAMPLTFFTLFVTALLIAPDMVTEIITSMRDATPVEITNGLRAFMIMLGLIVVIAIPIVTNFTDHRFGYANQFKSAIGERVSLRIRSILEVPADGEVEVHVGKDFRS